MYQSIKVKKCYSLKLADGNGWNIFASEKAGFWLDTLASIMRLKKSHAGKYPKLVFIRKSEGRQLPHDGWSVKDLKVARFIYHKQISDVICELGEDRDKAKEFLRMWFFLLPIYRRIQNSGGLPLHGALIEKNGNGMLLLAPSGAGKSTCSKRMPFSWRAHSDDTVLVVKNSDGRYLAHPYPTWSDYLWQRSTKKWDVEKPIKISAIFFLEKSYKDKVIAVRKAEAAIRINRSASEICRKDWISLEAEEQRDMKIKLFDNACELARSIPAFKLKASLTGKFWEKIEDAVF